MAFEPSGMVSEASGVVSEPSDAPSRQFVGWPAGVTTKLEPG